MSRHELLSPEGLRLDGRRWNDIRRFSGQISTQPAAADGSSYVSHGNTQIICTVSGPAEPSRRDRVLHDKACVSVEVCFAAFSGGEHKRRGRGDKRVQEMRSIVARAFSQAILTHLHARSEITITLHILSQDGSILASAINAATLALIDAGVPMYDYVSACTAGIAESATTMGRDADADAAGNEAEVLLDVNSAEEGDLPSLTVATMGVSERIVVLLCESRLGLERLEGMLAVAVDGCAAMRGKMDEVVRKQGEVVRERGGV